MTTLADNPESPIAGLAAMFGQLIQYLPPDSAEIASIIFSASQAINQMENDSISTTDALQGVMPIIRTLYNDFQSQPPRMSLDIEQRTKLVQFFHGNSMQYKQKFARSSPQPLEYLDRIIWNLDEALKICRDDIGDDLRLSILVDLCEAYDTRWLMKKTPTNLEMAEKVTRQTIPLLENLDHQALPNLQNNLGLYLFNSYMLSEANGRSESTLLQEAISTHQQLLRSVSRLDTRWETFNSHFIEMHKVLRNLSARMEDRFWDSELFSYLNQSFDFATAAWQILSISLESYHKATAAQNLGNIYHSRYLIIGRCTDLILSIYYGEICRKISVTKPFATPDIFCGQAERLCEISAYYDQEDRLDDALETLQIAYDGVDLSKENPTRNIGSGYAVRLLLESKLYCGLHARRYTQQLPASQRGKYINRAVLSAEASVLYMQDFDPGLSAAFDMLATALKVRYDSFQQTGDLDMASAIVSVSVGLAEHNYSNIASTLQRAGRLTCASITIAGDILASRYARERCLHDLNGSIHASKLSLKSVHSLHPKRLFYLYSYRNRLVWKMQSYDDGYGDQRLNNLIKRWSSLAVCHGSAWKQINRLDLERIMTCIKSRYHRGPRSSEHVLSTQRPRSAAIVLGCELLYDDFQPVSDPRGAYESDLRISTDDQSFNLAGWQKLHQDKARMPEIEHLCKDNKGLLALIRDWKVLMEKDLLAFEKLSLISQIFDECDEDKDLYLLWKFSQCVLTLMRGLKLHLLDLSKLTKELQNVSKVAMESSLIILKRRTDPWVAVEILEAGRENFNIAFSEHRPSHRFKMREIFPQAKEIQAALEKDHEYDFLWGSGFSYQEFYARKARRWPFQSESEDIIASIQGLANCQRLIEPFGRSQIMRQAELGTIIMLFCTKFGSHAIIITSAAAHSITLPKFHLQDAVHQLQQVRLSIKACERKKRLVGQANTHISQLLKWLWEVAVGVIVNFLGFKNNLPVERMPRIQWVCCGILSQMPVHAAGVHTTSGRNLAQYAVSSYISSVRDAVLAQQRTANIQRTIHNSLLHVSMPITEPTTEGKMMPLNTEAEYASIKHNFPQMGSNCLVNPDIGSLQSLLQSSTIVHFGGHGLSHPTEPSLCRLVIQNDATAPLTVDAIRSMTVPYASLAFLSACHGVSNPSLENEHEVVHVAKAFQLAGFPSVVGSLWQAYEPYTTDLTGNFYAYVSRATADGKKILTGDLWARALHFAVQKLKEQDPWQNLIWASWVHHGV